MAYSHRATGAAAQGTGTSIVTNAPAGVQIGDLLILAISMNGDRTVTTPTGWTLISSVPSSAGGAFELATYWRIATGGADDTPTVTVNLSSTYTAYIVAYVNPHATPFDEKADTAQSSVDTTFEIGSVTVDNDDSMCLIIVASNTSSVSTPTGYTARVTDIGTVSDLFILDNFNVDTGVHSPGNLTAGSANRFAATLVAFRSASSNAPPVITSNGGGATATLTANEGQTAVTTMVATGTPAPTWSITGGADSGDFAINSGSGVLTFASAPDYDSPADADTNSVYVVEVTATNSEGTDVQTLTVVVNPLYTGATPDAPLDDAEYFYRPLADHVAGNTQYANHGTRDEPLILGTTYETEADEDPDWVSDGVLGNHLRWLISPPTYAKAFIPEAVIDNPSFAFAIRIRPQATGADQACFNVMQANGTDKAIYLHLAADNHWYARIWDVTQSQVVAEATGITVNTSTTYNVVMTWDEATTTLRLYVDGVEEAETVHTEGRILVGQDSELEFPRYPQGLEQNAKVFRMAFWDRCPTPSEVADLETSWAWTTDAASDPGAGGGDSEQTFINAAGLPQGVVDVGQSVIHAAGLPM